MLNFGSLKFNISPARSKFWQNLLPTGEMLKNLVGFGGKKVSEIAEMLNMLNFFGVFGTYRAIFPISSETPKSLTCLTFPQFRLLFCHQSPPSLTVPLREANFDKICFPQGNVGGWWEGVTEWEWERELESSTERETERDKETERQRERERYIERDRETKRQREREREREGGRRRHREAGSD